MTCYDSKLQCNAKQCSVISAVQSYKRIAANAVINETECSIVTLSADQWSAWRCAKGEVTGWSSDALLYSCIQWNSTNLLKCHMILGEAGYCFSIVFHSGVLQSTVALQCSQSKLSVPFHNRVLHYDPRRQWQACLRSGRWHQLFTCSVQWTHFKAHGGEKSSTQSSGQKGCTHFSCLWTQHYTIHNAQCTLHKTECPLHNASQRQGGRGRKGHVVTCLACESLWIEPSVPVSLLLPHLSFSPTHPQTIGKVQ